ncbi:hypothetical protein [Paenibacillus tepidiphilus]|uniref:hypothetical protein n=1 Tax=Paenibacillus tepidiphilus TaxID=2608683 RepID=UPI0012396A87|nr:hypothetical protein [Paenibacillus tepidiphilus]
MRAGRARAGVLALLLTAVMLLSACGNQDSVFHTGAPAAETTDSVATVPWDYRVVESTVGDLVGSDMTVLPDNELLPNDNNYATGDKVWTLQFMDAELTTTADQKNEINLSAWDTLKTYPDHQAAIDDLSNLKVSITTDVDLVGVYQTSYQGKTRNFAVLELPSGNRIKQPIDNDRYKALEKQKTASVVLEEVHDFADYDLAYAKFRGWAN